MEQQKQEAYEKEVERRFRHQTPDGEPIGDMRDTELPFKPVFTSGFDAGYAAGRGQWTQEEQAIYEAWTVEGKAPNYHRAAQRKLQNEWPTLSRAIGRILEKHRAFHTEPQATTEANDEN